MNNVLIIGSGGVAKVAAHKCFQYLDDIDCVCIASRNKSNCDSVRDSICISSERIITAQVDADNPEELRILMDSFKPDITLNLALPYQSLTIMEACLEHGSHYLDTACYEEPGIAKFEYRQQWSYHDAFKKKNLMCILGCGFDPGVTNAFTSYCDKVLFDRLESVDIMDCNDGSNGLMFATNYNPEINIREISAKGRYWDGCWKYTEPLQESLMFPYPDIGYRQSYLMYHDELESLIKNYPDLKRIRFFMTFTDRYLEHLHCLQNVGMTSVEPIMFNGVEIVPLQFLTQVLPRPSSLGPITNGKTSIGCLVTGFRDGSRHNCFIYNNCDHQECFAECGTTAVAYTAGVPAAVGALMVLRGEWNSPGVMNVEQLPPEPFLELLSEAGLPWTVLHDISPDMEES